MNGKDLLLALSFVDEELIQESEGRALPLGWRRWASAAACVGLLLLGAWAWKEMRPHTEHAPDNTGRPIGNESITQEDVTEAPAEGFRTEGTLGPVAENDQAEVPAVIVRIDTVGKNGFTATVVEQVDSEVFPVGTELTVRLQPEEELKESVVSWTAGDVVYLTFIPEDLEQGIVYADQIMIYDEEEG